jgi:hypothetical protein
VSATKTLAAIVAGALCVAAGVDVSTRPPERESMLTIDPGVGSPKRLSETPAPSSQDLDDDVRLRWHVMDAPDGRKVAFATRPNAETIGFAASASGKDRRVLLVSVAQGCTRHPVRPFAIEMSPDSMKLGEMTDVDKATKAMLPTAVRRACRIRRANPGPGVEVATMAQGKAWASSITSGRPIPLDEGRMATSLVVDGSGGMEGGDGGSGLKAQSAKNEESR